MDYTFSILFIALNYCTAHINTLLKLFSLIVNVAAKALLKISCKFINRSYNTTNYLVYCSFRFNYLAGVL